MWSDDKSDVRYKHISARHNEALPGAANHETKSFLPTEVQKPSGPNTCASIVLVKSADVTNEHHSQECSADDSPNLTACSSMSSTLEEGLVSTAAGPTHGTFVHYACPQSRALLVARFSIQHSCGRHSQQTWGHECDAYCAHNHRDRYGARSDGHHR